MRTTTADQIEFNQRGYTGYILWYQSVHGREPPLELVERLYARSRRRPALLAWSLFTFLVDESGPIVLLVFYLYLFFSR